jgi:ubiquinone/menaquinone biosynthesis C-methylase UbiE
MAAQPPCHVRDLGAPGTVPVARVGRRPADEEDITMSSPTTTPYEELRHLFLGFRVSQALYTAAALGIADLLSAGPKSADELAALSGAHPSALARVLRLLASEGVFAETANGRFALTPLAEVLRHDAPASLRPLVLFNGGETLWRSWGHLLHAVRTGEPAFDHVHGVDFFAYFRDHPDEAGLFDQVMTSHTALATRALAAAYDFSPFRTIVDVGAGRGALMLGLLAAYPQLRGIVFDQPPVAEGARQAIEAAGLSRRCTAVGGDFFAAVPEGGDAYLLKFILHDWDDDRCVAILRACRRVVPAQGRVLVIELLIPPGEGPSFAKSQDVNMLVNLGGRERTEAEYGALYRRAGFDLTRTIRAEGELHVIEGMPV